MEGCAATTSGLVLVRFGVRFWNFGDEALVLGDPHCPNCLQFPGAVCGDPRFECSPAGGHNHPHYLDFARYELLKYAGGGARAVAFAVAPDEPPATMKACYWHAIRLSVTKGLRRLELGACRPVLTDGVAQYKRKCGAAVGVPTTLDHMWLRYRDTPGTRAALTAAPLVVAGADRRLRALTGCRGTSLEQQLARIETPGLHETLVLPEPDTRMEWPLATVPAP